MTVGTPCTITAQPDSAPGLQCPPPNALQIKGRLTRRALMALPQYSRAEIAVRAGAAAETVSRWMCTKSQHAPNLAHMLALPDDVVDALLSSLALERERLGFARRQWAESSERDDERSAK